MRHVPTRMAELEPRQFRLDAANDKRDGWNAAS